MMAEKEYGCPVSAAIAEIGGRWKPRILWALKDGKLRFNENNKTLPTITPRMIIKQLRELRELY